MSEAFGEYELIRKIATGGMAEVFLAKKGGEGGFSKAVAIKRIFPHLVDEPDALNMFLDEARIAASFPVSPLCTKLCFFMRPIPCSAEIEPLYSITARWTIV